MKKNIFTFIAAATLAACPWVACAQAQPLAASARHTVPVTADNFARAESDTYFARLARDEAFGKLRHRRELARITNQTVIRLNRDTLYSSGVFDLDAGPVTITLPDPGQRYVSLQVVDEDHYTHHMFYGAGAHTLTRAQIGTRYVMAAMRFFLDPASPTDVEAVHRLQDAVKVEQPGGPGSFSTPPWDPASQKGVRDALLALAATLPDTDRMFGAKGQVDAVRHLIGSASAWGGIPEKETTYLNVVPARNDGKTVHALQVKDVPVDGFWSISVYNAQGYYEPNAQNAYTLNNLSARKEADGSVKVQFGGCDGKAPNCLPIMAGWNYMVRLYLPRAQVLNRQWTFPSAQAMN
ncbi:hypothetical protein J2W25_001820 [Variovorax boronicumulans]|uniref:Carboxylesterase n=1 Tax=Variovorax boronicumulans TaxID=436515 RepID=A0AAW8DTZ4_9BURK|nr:DUF1254 domain-containing protein [Variovorax boronicumulans]MDP9877514.1 hypothetical protein [Variovorax boronicumulans]MDP9922799.1 hypothetical protein [Variovorax boronicumulans]